MSLTAILLVLLSAAIHIGWNALVKSSESPRAFALLKGTVLVSITLGLAYWMPLGAITPTVWLAIIASGIVHFVYILALSSAYETGDISFVYPIARSAPAFVPIAAYLLLGEILAPRGVSGILLVVVCIFLLQFRGEGVTQFQRLRASLRQHDFLWAFLTLLSVISYTIIDKAGMVAFHQIDSITIGHHGPVYFMLENAIAYVFFAGYLLGRKRISVGGIWRTEWLKIIVAGIGTLTSYSLILHVMQTEPVSYIVTLRQSSVLMAVLIGSLIFKEHLSLKRLIVVAVMLCGFYLVSTAN